MESIIQQISRNYLDFIHADHIGETSKGISIWLEYPYRIAKKYSVIKFEQSSIDGKFDIQFLQVSPSRGLIARSEISTLTLNQAKQFIAESIK